MAGGFIFKKAINGSFQDGFDKSLLIEPNYAYQVPFSFTDDWNEIKIGMFISFVDTGVGNENSGYTTGSSTQIADENSSVGAIANAGGTTPDTFFNFGIIREGATNELPQTLGSSGFMGMRGNVLFTSTSLSNAKANRLCDTTITGRTDGAVKIFSSTGATVLQETPMTVAQGNWCAVGLDRPNMTNDGTINGTNNHANPNEATNFFWYWGATFRVINKGDPNQMIRLIPSAPGSITNKVSNTPHNGRALSDPSTGTLVSLINGNNEFNEDDASNVFFTNMVDGNNTLMPDTSGHIFNDGTTACALPDSFFVYNGFSNVRPRIHAWAVKKIS